MNNLEQMEAVALPVVIEFLNKRVRRKDFSFGMHEGKLACFIDLKPDKQQIVFVSESVERK